VSKRYNLIKCFRGKETLVMTNDLQKVNDRLKTLRQSHRGTSSNLGGTGKATFRVEEVGEDTVKFKKKPHKPYGK